MHFGAAIRNVLSATCGSDLRDASARTVIPALRSPETQRVLAAEVEAAFGVALPAADLARLNTVRDVLQCVRVRRWAAAVDQRSAASERPAPAADAAVVATAPTAEGVFRVTRRPAEDMASPAMVAATASPSAKRP